MTMPRTYPDPLLLGALLLLACVTSAWKVTLPLSLPAASTLSVSYAADLMTLLMLGPESAVIVAVAGAWMQCTFKVKQTYPLYRTGFSMAGGGDHDGRDRTGIRVRSAEHRAHRSVHRSRSRSLARSQHTSSLTPA